MACAWADKRFDWRAESVFDHVNGMCGRQVGECLQRHGSQGGINVWIEELNAVIQFHKHKILSVLQQFCAVAWHDVGDGDVRNRENGAMLVYDADTATVDGGSAAHALQLDLFRDWIEHFDEDDAEFTSFQLIEIWDHSGVVVAFLLKNVVSRIVFIKI